MPTPSADITKIVSIYRDRKTKETTLVLHKNRSYTVTLVQEKDNAEIGKPLFKISKKGKYKLPYDNNVRCLFKISNQKKEFIIAEKNIPLLGAQNFRDLGGIRLTNGRYVKWGKLFRSDELARLTESDIEYLDSMRIRSIIDFRTENEVKKSPDKSIPTVKFNYPLAINPGAASSSNIHCTESDSSLVQQMQNMYRQYIREPYSLRAFRILFIIIQNNLSAPIVMHCSAGKDRTGIATALILLALGASESTVIENYMESNRHIPLKYQEFMKRYPRTQALFSVKRSYINAALDEIKINYGSIDSFLVDRLKVNITKLREIYTSEIQSF